jgi:hypothetical protein
VNARSAGVPGRVSRQSAGALKVAIAASGARARPRAGSPALFPLRSWRTGGENGDRASRTVPQASRLHPSAVIGVHLRSSTCPRKREQLCYDHAVTSRAAVSPSLTARAVPSFRRINAIVHNRRHGTVLPASGQAHLA